MKDTEEVIITKVVTEARGGPNTEVCSKTREDSNTEVRVEDATRVRGDTGNRVLIESITFKVCNRVRGDSDSQVQGVPHYMSTPRLALQQGRREATGAREAQP